MNLASTVAAAAEGYFTAPVGFDFQLNAVAQSLGSVPPIPPASVMAGNASAELTEQSLALRYPVFVIYCARLDNTLKEKFRTFSGSAQVVVDVRYSQDDLQAIQSALETYIGAVCSILDSSRGDWGNGLFYAGGYEVVIAPVKKGGQNFLQAGKVTFTVDVSI